VTLHFEDGPPETFDQVVFACHGDQVSAAARGPYRREERAVLSSFTTTSRNEACLHTDEEMLPTRRGARASWNYLLPFKPDSECHPDLSHESTAVAPTAENYCVTLNATNLIDPRRYCGWSRFIIPFIRRRRHPRTATVGRDQRAQPNALLRRILVLRLPRRRPELGIPGAQALGVGLGNQRDVGHLHRAHLRHRRFKPVKHEFTYPLFMVFLDIDRLPELMRVSGFTGYNQWNWASFEERDHFGDPSLPLRQRLAEDAGRRDYASPRARFFC
jgi:hypothetical protein